MRTTCFAFALLTSLVAACGTSGGPMGDDDDGPPDLPPAPERGFRVVSPEIVIDPGQEITYCYYFRTPNTESMAIKQWKSEMTPGSHHMIMYTTQDDMKPPGTVTTQSCGFGTGSGTNIPLWTYSAGQPSAEITLPVDDGNGQPIAQDIPANTAAFFQMHYLNATDAPLTVQVVLDAFALEANETYTKTSPYVTFNGNISIPPGATNDVESQTCTTPAGGKFWLTSTHAHKQAIHTAVKDAGSMVFESTDWEHPGAQTFMTPDTFFTFASGKLTYECTYANPGTNTIQTGDSAATDEMCMQVGYFFPASKPVFCYNNFIVPF
jgi:hypothetical protein